MSKDAEQTEEPKEEEKKKEEAKKPAPAKKTANAPKPAANASAKTNSTAAKSAKPAPAKPVAAAKKPEKKEEEDIPMDAAAIKAYSSVIADAAEDSEPQQPVQYTQAIEEEKAPRSEPVGLDPMGSMI